MQDRITQLIDDQKFSFGKLNVMRSVNLLKRITVVVAPTLSAVLGKNALLASGKELDINTLLSKEIDFPLVADCLVQSLSKMDDADMESLMHSILGQAMHEGKGELSKPEVFEAVFHGKTKLLFKVLIAALKVEYSDFFAGSPESRG